MLTTYLKRPQTLERYRSGPIGPHLDGFADWLEYQGYQLRGIRRLLRGVHHFSCWAQETGVHLEGLNEKTLESFEQHLQSQQRLRHPSGNHRDLFVGARHFVTFLESIHRVVPLASTQPVSSLPPLLVEFQHWMRTHRGVTNTTLNNYRLPLIDLLETLGDQPTQYNAQVLRGFILNRARCRSIGQAKSLVTPVRMFLRFLIATDRCAPGLDHAIPTIARWRLASLPKYLPPEKVSSLVDVSDQLPISLVPRKFTA